MTRNLEAIADAGRKRRQEDDPERPIDPKLEYIAQDIDNREKISSFLVIKDADPQGFPLYRNQFVDAPVEMWLCREGEQAGNSVLKSYSNYNN